MVHLLLLALMAASQPVGPGGPDLFIKAGRVHLGTGEVLEAAVIQVRDGRIVAVGKDVVIAPGATVYDLSAYVVMPGMVDGVSYAGIPGGRTANEEGREHTPSLRVAGALDGRAPELARQLRAGVTSLVVHPGSRNVIGGVACHVKVCGTDGSLRVADDAVALRITLGTDPATGQGRSGRSAGYMNRRPQSRMATIYEVREQLQRALNYRVRRSADDTVSANADYETILLALDGKISVHWQARTEKDIHAVLRVGAEFGLKRNVILEAYEADKCSSELAKAKTPVLVGPLFHPQYGGGPRAPMNPEIDAIADDHAHEHVEICLVGCEEDHEHKSCDDPTHVHDASWPRCAGHECCVAAGVAIAPDKSEVHRPIAAAWKLWRSGVPCGFARGGDVAGSTLLDFARFAVRSGLPADRALRMLTSEPARICGIDDRVGSIAKGKDADLVVLTGDPLLPTSAIEMVLIDGRIAFDGRKEKAK